MEPYTLMGFTYVGIIMFVIIMWKLDSLDNK